MSPLIPLTIAAGSHPGRMRAHNEDAFAILEPAENEEGQIQRAERLLVVADGLGGHNAGEVASRLAIETLTDFYHKGACLSDTLHLLEALLAAHARIMEEAARHPFRQGMGTTIALVTINGAHATAMHVGDSRIYLLRHGILSRLTLDHSWVEEQILAGNLPQEAAEHHPLRHVITQALGAMDTVEPAAYSWQLRPQDILLLCTDGLHGVLDEKTIHDVLVTFPPGEAVERLIALANERGGPDNITLIIAKVEDESNTSCP